jgi:outer membrane lipoprotein SlyB
MRKFAGNAPIKIEKRIASGSGNFLNGSLVWMSDEEEELMASMKLPTVSLILAVSAVVWTGCVNPDGSPNNTGSGALIGGAFGALVGAAAGGRHGGPDALIGAAAGVIAGGLIGHSVDEDQQARLRAEAPATYVRISQQQPLTVADIKSMAKAGVSEDVIINQIVTTHTGFQLASSDIIDLRNSGVTDKVVNFMIGTASDPTAIPSGSTTTVVEQTPPLPATDVVVAPPGPDYVWVGGEWIWNGRWVWVAGHWAYPPNPHVVWVAGHWERGPYGWYRTPGYWR